MENLILIALAFVSGGILKGATGAGAPIMAVPALAILFDVQFAVAVFVIPSVISNVWQVWNFRRNNLPRRFVLSFAGCGVLGAVLGSIMLASLPATSLMLLVALGVFAYIASRLLWQGWKLGMPTASRLVVPAGFFAGVLQGSTGISAPVSISFLNAMRLERAQFVATISAFFLAVSGIQFVVLGQLNIMNKSILVYGLLAVLPLAAGMVIGTALARYVSREIFDRIILLLLFAMAIKLIADAI